MTRFCTFASGSSGNAALLSFGGTHILIDMGISCRRIVQSLSALGLTPEDLAAVLITHEHNDHIAGLATYIKKYKTNPNPIIQVETYKSIILIFIIINSFFNHKLLL